MPFVLLLLAACAQGGAAVSDAAAAPDVPVAPLPDAREVPDAMVPIDGAPAADATPTGGYLDRCTSPGQCVSGLCVADVGGSHFCSRTCGSSAECASEHVCGPEGHCVPDDTGGPCSTATPETCALGLCLGIPGGAASCTRPCASAAECPSGFACTTVSSMKVCVDIEKPCSGAADCGSGLCLSGTGCTATCSSAADCPARLTSMGVSPYTCAAGAGTPPGPICVPPSDIIGSDPIGAPCQWDTASGMSLCRSGACDDTAPAGAMCTQQCSAQGGCAPGLGCFPLADGATLYLVCEIAGTGALGESCAHSSDCYSGLCDGTGVCTRLCADGLCPTGWTCLPVAGTGVAICRP